MASYCTFAIVTSLLFIYTFVCNFHEVHSDRTDAGRRLLFAYNTGIGLLELGTNVTSRMPAEFRADGVTFDISRGHIYWAAHNCSNSLGGIYRANADGSDATTVVSNQALGGNCIVRIAYDWIGGNIYFADRGANRIGLCHLADQLCTVIIEGADVVAEPVPIAVYPKIGRLFWGNCKGRVQSIYSAGMDGCSPVKVRSTGNGFINGIAIDFENARLYWADRILGTLESSNFDGSDHYVIANLGKTAPAGIDIMGDYLYWGEIQGKRIWRLTQRFSCLTTAPALLHDEGDSMNDLKVYDGSRQPFDRENPCVWAGCSHLCALSGEASTRCLCPAGLQLGSDGKTCQERHKVAVA